VSDERISEEDPADQIALAATLSAALETLDVAEREVMLLTAVQGLTFREASEILGEPIGTVKWRAHEATKQLRQILNAAEERYEARYGSGTSRKQEPSTGGTVTRFVARPNR
jgi:DNA-directed RNA polymerase specialized sigma24 family protein